MGFVDIRSFRVELASQIRGLAIGATNSKFNAAKKELLDQFEESAVTQELDGGVDEANISDTLAGYGNLKSFLGFDSEAKPTDELRSLLIDGIQIETLDPSITEEGDGQIKYLFSYSLPSKDEITEVTPLPWTDKSWVGIVENGADNFTRYLFSKRRSFPQSRSGPAVQVKNNLRSIKFKPVPYLTQMFINFQNHLENT